MNTSKIVGIVLIILSLAIGYKGYNKISESTAKVNVLGLKLEASDESEKNQGYLFLGIGAVLLAGGIYTLNKSKGSLK